MSSPPAPSHISHTHQIQTLCLKTSQTSEHSNILTWRPHAFLPSHLPIQTHIKFKHFIIKHSNISVSSTPHVSPSLPSSQTRQIKALENFFQRWPGIGVSGNKCLIRFNGVFMDLSFFISCNFARANICFCFSETFLFLLFNLQSLV